MDQMEDNEIELESVVIDSNTDPVANDKTNNEEKAEKLVRFPITRIKHLVKMDPDVNLCSQDALFIITKATVIILWICSHNYLTTEFDNFIFAYDECYRISWYCQYQTILHPPSTNISKHMHSVHLLKSNFW